MSYELEITLRLDAGRPDLIERMVKSAIGQGDTWALILSDNTDGVVVDLSYPPKSDAPEDQRYLYASFGCACADFPVLREACKTILTDTLDAAAARIEAAAL